MEIHMETGDWARARQIVHLGIHLDPESILDCDGPQGANGEENFTERESAHAKKPAVGSSVVGAALLWGVSVIYARTSACEVLHAAALLLHIVV